jgi:hypothetical protein
MVCFFVRISAWDNGVSKGGGVGVFEVKKSRLTARPKFGFKMGSESQISCEMLFSVN